MESTHQASGSCMCGKVTITTNNMASGVGACHCSMCRKWGGGPMLTADAGESISIAGEEHITRYNSSDWAERGFCNSCGTHLFYHLRQPAKYIMPLGFFDQTGAVKFDHQIFIDEKPALYSFANETHNMTGAEVFAAFSGDD